MDSEGSIGPTETQHFQTRRLVFIENVFGNKIYEPFSGLVVVNENAKILGAVILNNFHRGLSVRPIPWPSWGFPGARHLAKWPKRYEYAAA
jgi:hypothetical protein